MSILDSAEAFLGVGDSVGQVAHSASEVNSALGSIADGTSLDTAINQGMEGHRAGDAMPGSSLLPEWATKALGPIMQGVMGAALAPKRNPVAPLGGSGHGVSANTSGYTSLLNDATKLGNNDPLQGLTSFKNLL
ncbi:hypothetical protein [Kluyvera sp. CHPC 1.2972]|uniref:hypothetical protein n=1 Tax=Kluyvera sp. CHPC 1.2972 TaxID=2995176 RepID=UPI002FD81C5E